MKIEDHSYVTWARNRELARKNKAMGNARPWTPDPIINTYRFCNVSREHDKTTMWIKDNIRDPYSDYEDLVRLVALARFINLPSTLGALLDAGVAKGPRIAVDALYDVVEGLDGTRYSSAYMVRSETNKSTAHYGKGKIAYIAWILEQVGDGFRGYVGTSRERFVSELNNYHGFANFMSGQVAADLAYTPALRGANDHYTWAPQGPGAIRGMNRALGRPINASLTQAEYLTVGKLQLASLKFLGLDLHLHDVASNVNCETDKYLRVKNAEGSTRRYA